MRNRLQRVRKVKKSLKLPVYGPSAPTADQAKRLARRAAARQRYAARKAEKQRILSMDRGEQVWQGILERRKSDHAERKARAAQRKENYRLGSHTRRGAVRKTRKHGGNCIAAAALYGEEIHESEGGKHYYWKTSKSGKKYRRYCSTADF